MSLLLNFDCHSAPSFLHLVCCSKEPGTYYFDVMMHILHGKVVIIFTLAIELWSKYHVH